MSDRTRTVHRSSTAAVNSAAKVSGSPREDAEPPYERVDIDRYAVRGDGRTIGYVEVVPPLFVCYIGHPYPKAEEVAQSYDFHEAVRAVAAHADSAQRRRSAL